MATVWSGHPVGFGLLTEDSRQYVAYYNPDCFLTVASRNLSERQWETVVLPEKVGWDSHNYIVLGRDVLGNLHLSGNMHGDPLVYFRTREPDRIETFERMPMVGTLEDMVTYPHFFSGPDGDLCYGYRVGSAGSGDQVFNRYDPLQGTWSRLMEQQAVSGNGQRNAYLDRPVKGPDGYFHLCWTWRDNPDCSSNYDICYARSRDFVHWETSDGLELACPITYETAEVVDPIPMGQGLINGNVRLGFDEKNQVIISYLKLNAEGSTQLFHARRELGGWSIHQATKWEDAWLPSGVGTIVPKIQVWPVRLDSKKRLIQRVWRAKDGQHEWVLDSNTMDVTEEITSDDPLMEVLMKPSLSHLRVNWTRDMGMTASPYVLRWETWPENRDREISGRDPGCTLLQVVRLDPDFGYYPR